MTKPKYSPIAHRAATLKIVERADESPLISAALSSEAPAKRWYGTEILRHTESAIDLSRAADGLPLTINHSERDPASRDLPVGRVVNIRLDDDAVMRGDLMFDNDPTATETRGKVERGFAPDLSMTYRIQRPNFPDKTGTLVATRWTPLAVSIVTMPEDASVGVGRSIENPEGISMSEENQSEAGKAPSAIEQIQARSSAGFAQGRNAERERQNGIRSRGAQLGRAHPYLASQIDAAVDVACADDNMTTDGFESLLLDIMSGTQSESPAPESRGTVYAPQPSAPPISPPPQPGADRRPLIQSGGQDHRELVARGVELAFLERCGVSFKPEEMQGNQYRGWPVSDMQRAILEAHGMNTMGMNREQIAKTSIQMRAISPGTPAYQTSDFAAVTENVITKRVNDAFAAAEVTWNQWCSTIEVPDFKQFTIPRLSQISSLPIVAETAAYANLTQVDAKESSTLVKRGGLISWSWEAMVNDDMGMFLRTADRLGQAAARTLDENAYAVLTTNPTMGDANPLFDALHSNTGTDALDFDGIVATRTRMARQTDDNSELLGVILRYVIVPEELREQANQLAGAEYLPTTPQTFETPVAAATQVQQVNTLRGTFEVVSTVRLTETNDWYAQGAMGQGVEIAFLAGNRTPAIERESGWDIDAMHFKARHPSIAYPIDWRGLQRNVVA